MKTQLLSLLFALTTVATAHATDFVVEVKTSAGAPVSDASISVHYDAITPEASASAERFTMQQHEMTFHPHVLTVPKGAEVGFPNLDRVRHHVYSFSKGNRFELKLFGREDDRSVTFKKSGIAAVGCNIHDEMAAYIRVVDTPYVGTSNAQGTLALSGLPEGPATLAIWHPSMGAKAKPVIRQATIGSDGLVTVTLDLDKTSAR